MVTDRVGALGALYLLPPKKKKITMNYIDVFNGDADGICALHQLRLASPVESQLITGVKRDISLLKKVEAEVGDQITVLDISLDKNRDELVRLLDQGCSVKYLDHHFSGEIPDSSSLTVFIDTAATVCTSLLVCQNITDEFPLWAAVGSYGDNLYQSAKDVVKHLNLTEEEHNQLRRLGTYLNYNGYGSDLSDLHFSPGELYLKVKPYKNPFGFIATEPAFKQLEEGYQGDMAAAASLVPEMEGAHTAYYVLPNSAWARRVSGVFGNQLARDFPDRAHALLTKLSGGDYQVSVRAPLNRREGADTLCCAFPTGGGRKAAAGINHLPECEVGGFVDRFNWVYSV